MLCVPRWALGAGLWGPVWCLWGSGSGCYQLALVVSSMRFGLSCFARPSLPPRDWLQCRQMMRALLTLSSPPCACGMMWSTSALLGLSPCIQSSPTRHSGQLKTPASRAAARTIFTMFFHRAVLVRLAAMVATSPGGALPCPGVLLGPGGLYWWVRQELNLRAGLRPHALPTELRSLVCLCFCFRFG